MTFSVLQNDRRTGFDERFFPPVDSRKRRIDAFLVQNWNSCRLKEKIILKNNKLAFCPHFVQNHPSREIQTHFLVFQRVIQILIHRPVRGKFPERARVEGSAGGTRRTA